MCRERDNFSAFKGTDEPTSDKQKRIYSLFVTACLPVALTPVMKKKGFHDGHWLPPSKVQRADRADQAGEAVGNRRLGGQ